MVTLASIIDLPLDDAEAFLAFEEQARTTLEQKMEAADDRTPFSPFYLAYLVRVREAAFQCGVEGFEEWDIQPPVRSEEFQAFETDVLSVTTRLQFRVARRLRGETLEPDSTDREKIKFRVGQLQDQIETSDLPKAKKDALLAKLDELVGEFEGQRVNRGKVLLILGAIGTLMAGAQDRILKGPETVVAILDTVGMVVGKEEERNAVLERYRKPLGIEDKRPLFKRSSDATGPREDFSVDLDDEIPF